MTTVSTFAPSKYQEAIFQWVLTGRGDAVVNAVAGSGKTTTLIEVVRRIQSDSVILVAFNRHIADELGRRLVGTRAVCKTLHSVGFGAILSHYSRMRLDENKYHKLARGYAEQDFPKKLVTEKAKALEKCAHFARVTLIDTADTDQLEQMVQRYNIEDVTDWHFNKLPAFLNEGERLARYERVIDFTDQIYLPVKWELSLPQFDWALVDEAQDLSRCQRALAFKLRTNGGRMIFVGDPFQSIYGFAGADTRSFSEIVEATSPTVLPLSVCYRCPSSHIKLAQDIVPAIEPTFNAQDGRISEIYENDLPDVAAEGDLILCRLTAPLVKLCIKLIGLQLPARVKGRDIGRELASLAKRIAEQNPALDWKSYGQAVTLYETEQIQKLSRYENNETRIEILYDKCNAILACYHGFNAKSVQELALSIEGLFSDNRLSITLSTIHRAKGLENQRVFILYPDKLPLRWKKQTDDELQQELNVKYVALTRAKEALVFVKPETDRPLNFQRTIAREL